MKIKSFFVIVLLLSQLVLSAQIYIGNYNTNQYDPNSINNPYGLYGSSYGINSVNNPYGQYGNQYSNKSATNPYATNAPKLYDQHGIYKGKLSLNTYDPDSISNPYGRYGNQYSLDSAKNSYGIISIYGQ